MADTITNDNPKIQARIFDRAVKDQLSVRQVEALVRETMNKGEAASSPDVDDSESPLDDYDDRIGDITSILGSKVEFKKKDENSGRIVIHFRSTDELERILDAIDK